jgi:hypothetical protein
METGVTAKSDIMYDLWKEKKIANDDEPLIVSEEVGKGQVEE